MSIPSIANDRASNGQATEHNPQNTQESLFMETKSISINPRAIGTIGPNLNDSEGHVSTHIPQPTQVLSL
jgi:hypothetical protein